jgi:hypothetical protein
MKKFSGICLLLLSLCCLITQRNQAEGKIWKKPTGNLPNQYHGGNGFDKLPQTNDINDRLPKENAPRSSKPSTSYSRGQQDQDETEDLVDSFTKSFPSQLMIASLTAVSSFIMSHYLMLVSLFLS